MKIKLNTLILLINKMNIDLISKKGSSNKEIFEYLTQKIRDKETLEEDKNNIKDYFTLLLAKYSTELYYAEKYEEGYQIYLEAILCYPRCAYIWNEFGVFLQRVEELSESFDAFTYSLELDKTHLKAFNNICNVKDEIVERWHLRMLNNDTRNNAYKNAIQNKINEGYDDVLDIGTGTGLLSVYAHHSGAKSITACDISEIMCDISMKVFKENGLETPVIKLENKSSLELNSEKQFSLIITEILDVGIFGEGILQTLIDAKKRLLKPNGRIIPSNVTILISGYESLELTSSKIILNPMFIADFGLNDFIIEAENVSYESENLTDIEDLKFLTTIEEGLQVDFNNLDNMENIFNEKQQQPIKLLCEESGLLDGFLIWFKLNVDETNIINTKPQKMNCWDQAIFKFNQRVSVQKGDFLDVRMLCRNGLLHLEHGFNTINKPKLEVSTPIIKYINDVELLQQFNFISDKNFEIAIDTSHFPYMGLKLLKEKRIKFLYIKYFSKIVDEIIRQIELESKIDKLDVFDGTGNIELIIWSPVSYMGDLDAQQIEFYYKIRQHYKDLSKTIIIPKELNLCVKLINSDWLFNVTKVNNPEMFDLKIAKHINKYKTDVQFEIDNIGYEDISEEIDMGKINLNMEFQENNKQVSLKCDKRIDGILFYFEMLINEKRFSTNRNGSFVKKAAFVTESNANNIKKKDVTIQAMQNDGNVMLSLA